MIVDKLVLKSQNSIQWIINIKGVSFFVAVHRVVAVSYILEIRLIDVVICSLIIGSIFLYTGNSN